MSLTVARNVGFYSTRMSTASRPQLLAIPDVTAFRRWYEATLTELCLQEERPREPYWSQAFAVGSRAWLSRLADGDPQVVEHIRPLNDTSQTNHEAICVLTPPQSLYRRLSHSLVTRKNR